MIKKLFKFNKILFAAPLMTLMFCFNAPKNDDERMQLIMVNVKNLLAYHYHPKPINDAYSEEVYNNYFESLDPAKRYFLQSDMEEFAKHKTKLDDYLNNGNLVCAEEPYPKPISRSPQASRYTQNPAERLPFLSPPPSG